MNFRDATDLLLANIAPSELAFRLGIPVEELLHARNNGVVPHSPPSDWKLVIIRIAEERISHFSRLIARLRAS